MTTIGAGWLKTDKNEQHFISVKIDEAILPLTITKEKMISVKPNKKKESDNQPDYYLDLYIPDKTKSKKAETNELITEDEFPF